MRVQAVLAPDRLEVGNTRRAPGPVCRTKTGIGGPLRAIHEMVKPLLTRRFVLLRTRTALPRQGLIESFPHPIQLWTSSQRDCPCIVVFFGELPALACSCFR